MTASDDEYDAQAGGSIQLTEQDCAAIDALSAVPRDPHNVPHMDIVVDVEKTRQSPRPTPVNKVSPFQRFRPNGRLSVSDLVSPAWCEVQFEYGLLQHRSRAVAQRPSTFVSREGKQIHVKQKTAKRNDIVLQQGNAVHSALEREVHPTQVKVSTSSLEEYWGLRLFNMISDLQTLMLIGKCREFRVMGFVHDHFVSGVIDEITRSPLYKKRARDTSATCTPEKSKPKRTKLTRDPSPRNQRTLDSFFPITPTRGSVVDTDDMPPATGPAEQLHRTPVLRLSDSKTRLSFSLPDDSAALSSRLQLMTYKRLLDALLTSSPPYDFNKLWKRVGLNPERPFSKRFMEQVSPLSPAEKSVIKCVKDLEAYWWSAVRELGVNGGEGDHRVDVGSPVDSELTLVYRLRGSGTWRKGKREGRLRSSLLESSSGSEGEEDLKTPTGSNSPDETERGGGAQLKVPVESTPPVSTSESQGSILPKVVEDRANALDARTPEEPLDMDLQWALQESLRPPGGAPLERAPEETLGKANGYGNPGHAKQAPAENFHDKRPIKSGDIIGQKTFQHDDLILDAHITSILAWWHGEREPKGVVVEESYRCHTCEYRKGCEWREKKTLEARGRRVVTLEIQHSSSSRSPSRHAQSTDSPPDDLTLSKHGRQRSK